MKRLEGKVAIITGAADGIGCAIATAMANEGAFVMVADIQDDLGAKTVEKICKSGGKASYLHCDVSSNQDVSDLVETTVANHGKIDILVNNAAIAIGGMPIFEMTTDQWDKLISVNLSSVFYGCKAVLPHMIAARSGVIINMASAQAHAPLDGWAAYAGAKGAILSMTRQMAVEFGPHNIRVNSISPGTINTPMVEQVVAEAGSHLTETWVKMHPIGRIGQPEEVAEAAVYLASDLAGFTTGLDLRVDGALTCAPRYVPEMFAPDQN
ncbi:MAG: SDR family oxidoreductase [Rhizobiales bacterium]|nr:SDR family oxidoreductase [Hyphomicrobiales bacterium]NRB15460.1 SDR family oxidoreductase [Hyphomicrobiales bacterium]